MVRGADSGGEAVKVNVLYLIAAIVAGFVAGATVVYKAEQEDMRRIVACSGVTEGSGEHVTVCQLDNPPEYRVIR